MSSTVESTTPRTTEEFNTEAFVAAFDAASEAAGGVEERRYAVGGRSIVLRFAGSSLLHLAEAFDHLPAPAQNDGPALRVHLWDAASTGVRCPEPPFEGRVGEPGGLRVLWQRPPVRVVLQPGQSTVNAIDEDSGNAWFWCADPDELPFWERSTPIRMILHWWMRNQGLFLLHGAAVGFSEGGALIVGKGGSGKSTTSLLALRHGLQFASDDYVAVEPEPGPDGWPQVHSIFGSAKLTPEQYQSFPELQSATVNADKLPAEKAVVFVGRLPRSRLVRGFPLRAILVPHISGRTETTVHPISAGNTLTGLAPSTIFQLPGGASVNLAAMASIVRRVPGFGLELGSDLDGVPVAIRDLLVSLGVNES